MINKKVTRWMVMLSKFDPHYLPQKAINRRIISDFRVDMPTENQEEENTIFQMKGSSK